MARPKKDGKRTIGVQGKSGWLYIVVSRNTVINGRKRSEKRWITTGLPDTPENVKKASEMRKRFVGNKEALAVDRNISVADFTEQFLNKKKREVSDTTYSAYYYRAKRITEYFGTVKVREVDEVIVEGFLDSLFEVQHVQKRTVKDTKVLLRGIMEEAVSEGIIIRNPVKNVVINKKLAAENSKERNASEEFFSYEEAQLFLSKIKDHELYELFYVTLFFGLRREEILGLRWSAIDFINKTMIINHTVTRGTTINRLNATKTESSTRKYPLTDEQIEMFKQLKARELANRELFGNAYHDNDYIFKHADGSLYYPDYPSKAFRKLIDNMPELPQDITFHGLRTSCVSILVHQGMDIKSIQKWVGHKDLDTTLRIYAQVKEKEAKREILDKMKEIIPLKKYKEE